MGLATLAGHRVTSARAHLPAWGCWSADASIDGEVTLTGAVELKIADLTLQGTVLSGGPAKGRSHFRIVAGAGGWGRTIPRKSYVTDAGVKLTTVLQDAASAVGETVDAATVSLSDRLGPYWTRPEESASQVLELVAPGAWYVGEDGVTRLGRRAASTLSGAVTHGPVDRARGTVTLASESIAAILPGVTVDGLEAVDVAHTISAKDGLRSTIWGATASATSRRLAAMRAIFDQLYPDLQFRGVTEYRVVTRTGKRLNLQPVRVSSGMPDLLRVRVMPGVPGCEAEVALGAKVLVTFVNADPGRPVVVGFEDAEGASFQPGTLSLLAGGQAGGEHVMTLEALTVILHNLVIGLGALGLPATWLTAGVATTVINGALAASAAAVPPTEVAQLAVAPSIAALMLNGSVGHTSSPYAASIALLATKTPNDSGLFPSIGAAAVETG